MNYNATVQVINETQQKKKEKLENLLNTNFGQIEQLQREVCIFKSKIIQQCDKVISSTNEWIKIYNPLQNIFSELNQINQLYIDKVIDQIQNLDFKEVLIKNCENLNLKLININLEFDKQFLQLQQQQVQGSYLTQIRNVEKQLNLYPSSGIVKMVPIHTLKLSKNFSMPSAFNTDGNLLITSDYLNNIIVWYFDNGKQDQITTIEVGITPRSILLNRQGNHLIIGLNGGGIYMWKQINEEEWRGSQLYMKHEFWIKQYDIKQSRRSIIYWRFKNHYYFSFNFNDSENLLISCSVCEYIIWQKQQSKWEYLCNEKIKRQFQAKFLKDNCFCLLPINQQINSLLINEIYKGCFKQTEAKTIKLIQDNDREENMNSPMLYNKLKTILVVKSKGFIYIIRQTKVNSFEVVGKIVCLKRVLSDDGKFLIFFDMPTSSVITYELLYE
ncbi:unnamed protein product [Paramecium octaurelia]|uniref:WD40-repeat-containing domain n=1 Tax=Paramecium octaurelia TaxID=43137 RepID=A0A8S1X6D6_PAROT|nr:unnamed protein product [Paramecium octaurelia]